MRVWLDDERSAPDGWVRVRTVDQALELLRRGTVEEISLDNDLGEGEREGREVVTWLEEMAHAGNFDVVPDEILVHSANSVAAAHMRAGVRNIERWREQMRDAKGASESVGFAVRVAADTALNSPDWEFIPAMLARDRSGALDEIERMMEVEGIRGCTPEDVALRIEEDPYYKRTHARAAAMEAGPDWGDPPGDMWLRELAADYYSDNVEDLHNAVSDGAPPEALYDSYDEWCEENASDPAGAKEAADDVVPRAMRLAELDLEESRKTEGEGSPWERGDDPAKLIVKSVRPHGSVEGDDMVSFEQEDGTPAYFRNRQELQVKSGIAEPGQEFWARPIDIVNTFTVPYEFGGPRAKWR